MTPVKFSIEQCYNAAREFASTYQDPLSGVKFRRRKMSALQLFEKSFFVQFGDQARVSEVGRLFALELRDCGSHVFDRRFQRLSDRIGFFRVESNDIVRVGGFEKARVDLELFLHHAES